MKMAEVEAPPVALSAAVLHSAGSGPALAQSFLGAGPAEAAALAFDPPLRFGVSYTIFQLCGVVVGWWCGAAVGVGTIILAAGIGWSIDRLMPLLGHQPRPEPN